jgi:NADH:ubiquinone oxidoreductase subunit F (NADH-binding)
VDGPKTSILRALTALQQREGWLPGPRLEELARELVVPLHRLESLSTFYTHFRRVPPTGTEIAVCRDVACRLAGGAEVEAGLSQALADLDVEITEVSCLGRCDAAPVACVGGRVCGTRDVVALRQAIQDPTPRERSVRRWAADPYGSLGERYGALREALAGDRNEIVGPLEQAGLRGMGGAGFPAHRKWSFVAEEASTPKFVICNADESEPGTFKDREILHDLPHLVIEGMALAARFVGASRGSVFIRHEYEAERLRLEAALAEARTLGVLGSSVLGSDFAFEIDVFVSPGGYILGEETALLECMEDRRGEPRNKPPFPGRHGLQGQPTLINNVETFAHAAAIIGRGAEWWQALGRDGFAGHKFMAVSGDVARPGVELVPVGSSFGELLEACGGMRDGAGLAAFAPGGASSRFLPPSLLDLAIDFDAVAQAGSMLGSGAAIFVAEGRDLVAVGLDVTRFFRNESCGKCVPCRVGTEKAVKLVEAAGADAETRAQLHAPHATLEQPTICGLGQVALAPLLSLFDLDDA